MLRADGDGHAPGLAVGVRVLARGVQPAPGVGLQAVELQPLVLDGVLHPGFLQVVQDHGHEPARCRSPASGRLLAGRAVPRRWKHAVRRQALHRERPGHADALVVLVGLVVEQLGVGAAGDGGVDLLLPLAAQLPPLRVQLLRPASGHFGSASRGISHSSQACFSSLFSSARTGSSCACHFAWMASISSLLAMDLA